MSETETVALNGGGLPFTRVMPGEYFCDTPHGRYEIDQTAEWCTAPDCDHGHQGWALELNQYGRRERIGRLHRTLTDAKIAALVHSQTPETPAPIQSP